ncbi:MAG TPA: hypothetical protein VG435_07960 [Acidimicrobiales bacterium]|nr:hypothetical protein [Acidimicrobiales bacterium]
MTADRAEPTRYIAALALSISGLLGLGSIGIGLGLVRPAGHPPGPATAVALPAPRGVPVRVCTVCHRTVAGPRPVPPATTTTTTVARPRPVVVTVARRIPPPTVLHTTTTTQVTTTTTVAHPGTHRAQSTGTSGRGKSASAPGHLRHPGKAHGPDKPHRGGPKS